MPPKRAAVGALVVLFAVGVGYVNTHTDEVTVILAGVVAGGGILGIVQPTGAWRWGVVTGLAVPVSAAIAYLLGLHVPYPNSWGNVATSLVAFPPALAAAYVGAVIGRAASPTSP